MKGNNRNIGGEWRRRHQAKNMAKSVIGGVSGCKRRKVAKISINVAKNGNSGENMASENRRNNQKIVAKAAKKHEMKAK
jgi:hypothetical protein